ncbi:MAG: zf-HC2 domain-containing protein [Planctomycetes bacterium]|nr:zf-HC2 domain-containing protein [Planctomycetota bacterium]
MECTDIKNKIHLFLDGELPLLEKQDIESHLTQCDACRMLVEREGDLEKKIVDTLNVDDKALWTRAWSKFTAETMPCRHGVAQGTQRPISFYLKRWLPAASAAAVIIVLAAIFLLPVYHSQDLLGAIENEHNNFLSGKIRPSIETSSIDELNNHFTQQYQEEVCNCCTTCFRNQSFQLIGGRMSQLQGAGNSPCIYARYQNTPISFYIINKSSIKIKGVSLDSAGTLEGYGKTESGFNFVVVKSGKHYICAMGRVSPRSLSDLIKPLADAGCNCKD